MKRNVDDQMSPDTPTGSRLTSPLDTLLGYRLRRASMVMMANLAEALRPFNLSAGEASFLILVGANPGCRQSDVGRALEIKRANLTPLVGRMKARGLVLDTPIDGRSLSLALTPAGITLQKEVLAQAALSDGRFSDQLALDETILLAALATISG